MAVSPPKNGTSVKDAQVHLSTTCPPPLSPPGPHKFKCLAVFTGDNTSGGDLAAVAKFSLSRLGSAIDSAEYKVNIPAGKFEPLSESHTFELDLRAGQSTVIVKVQLLDGAKVIVEDWRACDYAVE